MGLTLKQSAPFTTTSDTTGEVFERRGLYAYHDDELAGYLRVGRIIAGADPADQRYHAPDGSTLAYVCYRETFKRPAGKGLGELLIPEAHARWRKELGPLYSGHLFVKQEATRLWQRLTQNNQAQYVPFTHDGQRYDRWRLL